MSRKHFADYPPLQFVKLIDQEPADSLPAALIGNTMLQDGFSKSGILTEPEWIRFASDQDNFFCENAEAKYAEVNQFLLTLAPKLLSPNIIRCCENGQADIRTELKDILLAPHLWKRWSQTKQVYQPDPAFASALLRTDSLQLTKNQLAHLPVQDFYVDLSGQDEFAPIVGGLVSVENYPTRAAISVYLLTQKLEYFSTYSGGIYDENGMITLPPFKEELPQPSEYDVFLPTGQARHYPDVGISRRKTSMLCLQILCYLTSKEPDITDSPRTASTYRPVAKGMRPKQKWSEVQIHDVGVRIGAVIRDNLSAAKNQQISENASSTSETETSARKPRKSPIPHFRHAHWQRFWTGKGRTVCEVVWCAPAFVGREPVKDIVVHRIVS